MKKSETNLMTEEQRKELVKIRIQQLVAKRKTKQEKPTSKEK